MSNLHECFAAGYACLSAWADLFDRINVFPVADGDTGTNLRISLAPLRNPAKSDSPIEKRLALCATGNSGNIAAAFFQEFCQAGSVTDLSECCIQGKTKAWQAIADPCKGTMLSVFDSLASSLASGWAPDSVYEPIHAALLDAVLESTELLPDCREAGVVDSGALAMFVFFDGFFRCLTNQPTADKSPLDLFSDRLVISRNFVPQSTDNHCVDAVIQKGEDRRLDRDDLAQLGKSLVIVEDESTFKVHIHTADPDQLHNHLGTLGEVVRWSDERIVQNRMDLGSVTSNTSALHIISDAAGSLSRELARQYGITLLDSYIVAGDDSIPESLCKTEQIYAKLRNGDKITTAQASTFERHQCYKSISKQHGPSLYLCVGSAFTGNYDTAMAWKSANDPNGNFTVIDTGAASGRLALIVLLTARYARTTADPKEIIAFANTAITECHEYVFIDELKYLVAGGRLAKSSGFFGDLLHMKPVITPTSDGAQKIGVVHSRKGQLAFALDGLKRKFGSLSRPTVMLQYSDNEQWVESVVQKKIAEMLPQAEIMRISLSITSGVHMGPGTWSMAFAPEIFQSPAAEMSGEK